MRPLALRSAAPTGKFENGQYARFWASSADRINSSRSESVIFSAAVCQSHYKLSDSLHDQRQRLGWVVVNCDCGQEVAFDVGNCIWRGEYPSQGLAGVNLVAHPYQHFETDGQVELVAQLPAAAT